MAVETPPARAWVTAGGSRYHFRVACPGGRPATPLVLVHGLGVSSAYWRRLHPLLATRRPVYALDLPGFGRSTRPRGILNSVGLSRALRDWLAALDLPRVHLLGHSLGGQVVAEFAREHPGRVARLVLVSATIGRRSPGLAYHSLGLLRDLPREQPSLLPVVLPDYLRAGPRRMVQTDLVISREDTVATVAQLALPVLLVRGTRDTVVSARDLAHLRGAAPQASVVEIPGAPHAVHWSHPALLAEIVNGFLAGGRDAG